MPIVIRKETVDHFKKSGLEVLGINHCDDLLSAETNKEDLENTAKICNEEFLKGKHTVTEI